MIKIFIYVVTMAMAMAAYGDPAAATITSCQIKNSTSIACRIELSLPEGKWEIAAEDYSIRQAYLMPAIYSHNYREIQMMAALNLQINELSKLNLKSVWQSCLEFARDHENLGPSSFSDLDAGKYPQIAAIKAQFSKQVFDGKLREDQPQFFLVPKAEFIFNKSPGNSVSFENRHLLAFEIKTYLADGRHLVLYTNGDCERIPINMELAEKYQIEFRSIRKNDDDTQGIITGNRWKLLIVRDHRNHDQSSLALENKSTNTRKSIDIPPMAPDGDDPTVLADLDRARVYAWKMYDEDSSSPVLDTWIATIPGEGDSSAASRRNRAPSTSWFNILGGRAAVQETLQMEVLNNSENTAGERTIPVSTLTGVTVKSHPYEDMLKGREGGHLGLANLTPADHFFVYVPRPSAILTFLDDGVDFFGSVGNAISKIPLNYDLKNRYLERLGIDQNWLKTLLDSGMAKECALVFPDLFFIDGTEITVISRLAVADASPSLLSALNLQDLAEAGISERVTSTGGKAFWARRGDMLIMSASRQEMDAVLNLQQQNGQGSLGESAEFRYMLTQLPVNRETSMFTYFSDSFIRHVVSPAVKIAQLRRIMARAEMEYLTSCALLAKLNGSDFNSIAEMVEAKTIPERFLERDYQIGADLIVRSDTYGTLARMKTLTEVPVDKVTEAEAHAYNDYRDNYTRYWRQFFDPIAMRLDNISEGSFRLETFILPLIDNSLYNGIKESIINQREQKNMKIPRFTPAPVLLFSLGIKNEVRDKFSHNLNQWINRYIPISPAILDDLEPILHLAIHDGDPVISLGSGDLLGVFGANPQLVGGSMMIYAPILLSILTRPCTLALATKNPARTLQILRQAGVKPMFNSRSDRFRQSVEYTQVDGRDSWILSYGLMGSIKLRFGLEVDGNYLLIRNLPWSNQDRITEINERELNGVHLEISPAACILQLPSLHTAAMDYNRNAAMQGAGFIYPLLACGDTTMTEVAGRHRQLFGFSPAHPDDGGWEWRNYRVISTQYGQVDRQRQPPYRQGEKNFGVLQDLATIRVGMQFEDTGLRTQIHWKMKASADHN